MSKGWVFGSEQRSQGFGGVRKSIEGVGPGMYHKELKAQKPMWTFGSDRKDVKIRSEAPGPGHYEIPSTIAVVAAYSLQKD